MQAERRYVDNDDVRNLCVQFVREHGSRAFFQQREWRRRLRRLVSDYRARHRPQGRYETVDERNRDVLKDLTRSREIIEARLAGHKATHLCYPWYEGAPFAVEASRRAGYRANYFGNVPRRPTNRPGDDPFHTPRVEGHLLERLPGRDRISLAEVFRRLYGKKSSPPHVGHFLDGPLMKIGVMLRHKGEPGGIWVYTQHVLEHLFDIDRTNEYPRFLWFPAAHRYFRRS